MPNLTSIGVTSGIPTTGTGTVSTIDALMAQLGTPVAVPTAAQALSGEPNVAIDQYGNYKPVPASQTTFLLGAAGAQYDYLAGILIVPGTTSPGSVLIRDGAGGSDMTLFTGGATSIGDLHPFMIPLGIHALAASSPGWRVTTGANVSVIGIGKFT
jgi:hypothetical protein